MQLGQIKARTIQNYLETSSKHSVLVQSKAPEERIAVFVNGTPTNTAHTELHSSSYNTKVLGRLTKTVYWCDLKLAQKRELQFYQTRSDANVLYNTLPAICIEKVVCMKTGEELYCKVFQSPRLPRVILKQKFARWTTGST